MSDDELALMRHSLDGARKIVLAAIVVLVAAWVVGSPDWAAAVAVGLVMVGVWAHHWLTP